MSSLLSTSENSGVYAYPQLSNMDLLVCRLLGPGLGNLLFTWARAVVAAKGNGLRLIQATWSQFRLAPLICGERPPGARSGSVYFS
jgi:hypothetical protein